MYTSFALLCCELLILSFKQAQIALEAVEPLNASIVTALV
jgi:hypothetical protein